MANKVYPKYREGVLQAAANTNLAAGAVKAVLIDLADYTYNDAHQFLSDIPAAGRVSISGAFANKTFVNGKFTSDPATWSAVTGDQSEFFAIFVDTGVDTTSPLVYFEDTPTSGLPVTPNGGDITLTPDGTLGWFTL